MRQVIILILISVLNANGQLVDSLGSKWLIGKIINNNDNTPVSYATIEYNDGGTVANLDGIFSIRYSEDSLRLTIKSIGLKKKEITIHETNDTLIIMMVRDTMKMDETLEIHMSSTDNNNIANYNESIALWGYKFDPANKDFKPTKLRQFRSDTLTLKGIKYIINKTWPKVQIDLVRTAHDTVFVSIPHSEVLTQQMGTSGAEDFMVTTTYSFTELKNIKFVSFDFIEGDHAVPGIYSRKSWDFK